MVARVLFQRTAAAPVAATLLLGGTVLYPRAAYAEAPESYYAKKPIYDDYDAPPTSATLSPAKPSAAPSSDESSPSSTEDHALSPITAAITGANTTTTRPHPPRGPTPTDRLAVQIRRARLFLYRQAAAAEDGVNRAADRVFHLERSFTETLASLAPPKESGERLLPGAVYVLVAAMAGSIVTRRRGFLLRTTVPVAFGVGAGWALLPLTMRNVADLAWTYEQRVPAVADAHLRTRDAILRSISFAKVHTQVGRNYAEEKVHAVRETVEDWVKQGK